MTLVDPESIMPVGDPNPLFLAFLALEFLLCWWLTLKLATCDWNIFRLFVGQCAPERAGQAGQSELKDSAPPVPESPHQVGAALSVAGRLQGAEDQGRRSTHRPMRYGRRRQLLAYSFVKHFHTKPRQRFKHMLTKLPPWLPVP